MSKVVHFEIPIDNSDRARSFYHDVLDWEISKSGDMPYWLVRAGDADEPGADGALIARGNLHQSPILIVGVEDIEDTLRRVERMAGEILQGKLPIPGVGWSAYIRDTEGNTIGVFQQDQNAVPLV